MMFRSNAAWTDPTDLKLEPTSGMKQAELYNGHDRKETIRTAKLQRVGRVVMQFA